MRTFFLSNSLATVALIAISSSALAGVTTVKSPGVTKDKASAEYKMKRYGDDRKSKNNAQSHEVEVSYGITDDVSVGLEYELKNPAQGTLASDALAAEAKWELTQQGEYALSSGVFANYSFATQDNAADSSKLMGIIKREEGPFGAKVNASIEREFGDNRGHGLALTSALAAYYTLPTSHYIGLEWHGDYGSTDRVESYDNQEHYVGPFVAGNLMKFAESSVSFEAVYYWGITDASADNAQRVKLEYSQQF